MRLCKITGTRPTATSASEGSAASPRRSSRASWLATTASVSVLKGRSTMVAGSSFITSTNTSSAAAKPARRSSGQCTRAASSTPVAPSIRADSPRLRGTRA